MTAVPDGVELNPEAVPVDAEGVAEVRLEPALAVTRADRDLLLAQIDASLRPVPGISSVQVYARDVPLEGSANLESGSGPPGNVEFLQDDRLVALVDGEIKPVPGLDPLDGLDPRSPARNEDGSVRVMLSGAEHADHGADDRRSARRSSSAARAWSRRRSTGSTGPGRLSRPAGSSRRASVRRRRAGRAPTGSRAGRCGRSGWRATGSGSRSSPRAPTASQVDVAAITRDESGAPQQLGSPVRAGASLVDASSVVWVGGVDARGRRTVRRQRRPCTWSRSPGRRRALPEVANLADLAGSTVIYVTTTDGELRRFVGSTWAQILGVTGASYPSFPG